MLSNYTVGLQQKIGPLVLVLQHVRATSETDAVEVARQTTAQPHHWEAFHVKEED